MRFIRTCTEDEMIHAFLKMEVSSARFGSELRACMNAYSAPNTLLYTPNLSDAQENALRRKLLGDFRGYGQNRELFTNYPPTDAVSWSFQIFESGDLDRIRYIRYDYWDALSSGTSRPRRAAENIRDGMTVFDVPNDGFFSAEAALHRGVKFPPLILMHGESTDDFVLVEGHQRATAYALAPEYFTGTPCYVGVCTAAQVRKWNEGV